MLLALGQGLAALVGRTWFYRRSRASQQLARYQTVTPTAVVPDHVLYDYPDLPWSALGIGLAAAGLLALLPFLGFPGALVAVVLERAPYLVRGMLRREGQARLRLRIRDFVDDLREAVAIHGSLGKALDALVAAQGERTDALALVLARRARSRSAQLSADQVLDGMAADLKSPDMREVAAQVRLALAGGMDLAERVGGGDRHVIRSHRGRGQRAAAGGSEHLHLADGAVHVRAAADPDALPRGAARRRADHGRSVTGRMNDEC